jgi:ribonucleoside-diphosphate reductase beta chain
MHVPQFKQSISINDRRLIGGPSTQALLPLKYKWLYATYKKARLNFWLPEEVGVAADKLDYQTLPANVKRQYDWLFSMLTTMDMVVTEAIDVSIMRHATAPELRQWLALQGQQEAIHTDTYTLLADEIGLDPDEVFGRYLQEETLYAKIAEAAKYSAWLDEIEDISKPGELEKFILAYTFFALVLEGNWFYMGLSAGTYPNRFYQKMLGTADQFSFIRRDEGLHYSVGLTVISDIIRESPQLDMRYVNDGILQIASDGIRLEEAFAKDTYSELVGLSVDDYMQHCRHLMKVNLRRLGLEHPDFVGSEPALPWVSETVDLHREFNFFERRNSEYQMANDLFADFEAQEHGWDDPLEGMK